jgi:hypothetical protein
MRALAITSMVAFGLIAATIGWFIMKFDPMGGEPVVVITLDVDKRQIAQSVEGGIPDVKTVTPMVPEPSTVTDQQTIPAQAFSQSQSAAMNQPQSPLPRAEGGEIRLPPVPQRALVETSRYGPLPRIATDGRRPSKIYARPSSKAKPGPGQPARIAILISGMGLSEVATTQAIESLPGPITLAFGPYGRNLEGWVRRSRDAGHEVMLQIPLEPFDYPDNDPGPHTLLTSLPREENLKRLHWIMSRFTGYTGITNYMGAKFAAAQQSFLPILEEIKSRGLTYLDDGTAARSTAGQIARDLGLDYSVSHVVIDQERNSKEIDIALKKLETIAQEKGFAIGIGSSLPITIDRVSEWVGTLEAKGIKLIPVSAAIHNAQQS